MTLRITPLILEHMIIIFWKVIWEGPVKVLDEFKKISMSLKMSSIFGLKKEEIQQLLAIIIK